MEVKLQIFVENILCGERRIIYPEQFEEMDFRQKVEAKEKFILEQKEKLKSFYKLDFKACEVYLSILCKDLDTEGEEYAELYDYEKYLRPVKVFNEVRDIVFTGTALGASLFLGISREEIMGLITKKTFHNEYSVRYLRV